MAYTVAETITLDKPIMQGLTTISSTQIHAPGYVVKSSGGQEYMMVQTCTTITAQTRPAYPAFFVRNTLQVPMVGVKTADYGQDFAGLFCASVGAANGTPGTNYVWIQTKGLAPSAMCSVAAAAVLYGTTAELATVPTAATCTTYKAVAIAMQASSNDQADVMLFEK